MLFAFHSGTFGEFLHDGNSRTGRCRYTSVLHWRRCGADFDDMDKRRARNYSRWWLFTENGAGLATRGPAAWWESELRERDSRRWRELPLQLHVIRPHQLQGACPTSSYWWVSCPVPNWFGNLSCRWWSEYQQVQEATLFCFFLL